MRSDLPIGNLCAQLLHAAGESSPGNLPSGTYAVALAAKNEAKLLALERKLLEHGVAHVSIREPDLSDSLTAIGFPPTTDRKSLRKFLAQFPLIGETNHE